MNASLCLYLSLREFVQCYIADVRHSRLGYTCPDSEYAMQLGALIKCIESLDEDLLNTPVKRLWQCRALVSLRELMQELSLDDEVFLELEPGLIGKITPTLELGLIDKSTVLPLESELLVLERRQVESPGCMPLFYNRRMRARVRTLTSNYIDLLMTVIRQVQEHMVAVGSSEISHFFELEILSTDMLFSSETSYGDSAGDVSPASSPRGLPSYLVLSGAVDCLNAYTKVLKADVLLLKKRNATTADTLQRLFFVQERLSELSNGATTSACLVYLSEGPSIDGVNRLGYAQ